MELPSGLIHTPSSLLMDTVSEQPNDGDGDGYSSNGDGYGYGNGYGNGYGDGDSLLYACRGPGTYGNGYGDGDGSQNIYPRKS